MTNWRYRLYGLEVASEIDLGAVPVGNPAASPDVWISSGALPDDAPTMASPDHWFAGAADAITIDLGHSARFHVTGGNAIRVADARAGSAALRWRLLGVAFGALLHQRRTLPLHATMVGLAADRPGEGVAIIGASGMGKSTLAAWMGRAGHALLIDDVCAMRFEEDGVCAEAGNGLTRLWGDAMAALALADGEPLDPAIDKFELPIARPHDQPIRLRALVEIADGDAIATVPLNAGERLQLCLTNTYSRSFLACTGGSAANFSQCARLAGRVPAFRLTRPRRIDVMPDVVAAAQSVIGSLA